MMIIIYSNNKQIKNSIDCFFFVMNKKKSFNFMSFDIKYKLLIN